MVRGFRYIPAVVALLVAVSMTSVAFAAPSAWQSVNVTLQSEQSGAVLLVSGELPAATPLPAEVELSVPSGSEIQWIGEILGGPVSEDPELKYEKSTANGTDVYRFTLTKSRVAQVEAVAGSSSFDGVTYGTSLRWVASQDVPSLRLSARVKQGAKIAQASPGASLLPGDGGYSYYSKTVEDVKAGTPVDLAFTYTLPSVGQTGTAAAGAGSSDVVPLLILSVLFGGGLIAMVFGVRRKLAAKAAGRAAEEAAARPAARSRSSAKSESAPRTKVLSDAFDDDETPAAPRQTSAASKKAPVASRKAPAASKKASAETPAPARGLRPQHVVVGALVLLLAVTMFVMARQATSSAFVGGTLTRSFGGASACTNVTIPLSPNAGVDFQAEAGKLMDSLAGLDSVGQVTITAQPPSIDVAYCKSTIDEQQVRSALESAGIATLGAGVVKSSDGTPSVTPTATQ